MEFRINKNASEFIKDKILQSKSNLLVRVYMKGSNWGSIALGLALDEPNKDDRIYETDGIKIIVDKKINKKVKGVKIDVVDTILGKRVVVEDLYKSKSACC